MEGLNVWVENSAVLLLWWLGLCIGDVVGERGGLVLLCMYVNLSQTCKTLLRNDTEMKQALATVSLPHR